MVEEPMGVPAAERRQRRTNRLDNRLDQRFFRPGFGLTHEPLDLRERFLDGVILRRVGRQVDELAASPFDQLFDPLSFVGLKRLSITTT
jgi:hypothetical protein